MNKGDREAVAELLGRAPQGAFEVVVRDEAGRPVVIMNSPLLADGTPMPTRYWLVGRRERDLVSRLESAGGVRAAEAAVDKAEVDEAHSLYAEIRDAAIQAGYRGPRPSGGVGGTRRGVKCLHAHLAWYLAGGPDPVGHWTCEKLGVDPSSYHLSRPPAEPVWTEKRPGPGPVAAVDCGTNSTRLLVVDGDGRPLDRLMRITRLGQDVDKTGLLGDEAMARTLEVLREFRDEMTRLGVVRFRATATSAARDARNAGQFAAKVTEVLGASLEVLGGEEEGRLTYLGATAELDPSAGPYLVIDVGGGSTELVGGAGPALDVVSLEIGCVRATERFFRHDPPLSGELEAARAHVRKLVLDALEARTSLGGARRLIGVAGTVAALARLELGLEEYDRDLIHHAKLSLASIERLLDELGALPVVRRLERPALEPERADVIVGGALVLAEAMAVLGFDELTASESDLLDGIVAGMLA